MKAVDVIRTMLRGIELQLKQLDDRARRNRLKV